jgi:hypothetical protein
VLRHPHAPLIALKKSPWPLYSIGQQLDQISSLSKSGEIAPGESSCRAFSPSDIERGEQGFQRHVTVQA